jgi:hypothetical protein
MKGLFFFCAAILMFPSLYGQSGGGRNLGTELQNLEKNLEKQGISGAERQKALVQLARLHELSGNIEGAATAWTNAASAEQGKRNDTFFLNGASCLAALGEWEKAGAAVKTVLLSGGTGPDMLMARFLGAQIDAFHSADTSTLASLLNDPGFENRKAAIYYTLWQITGNGSWKTRLTAEYPQSPEARIAAAGTQTISAAPTALWLLFPGRDSIKLETAVQAPASSAAPAATPSTAVSANTAILQTGLFSREENARAQAERLRSAGFSPSLNRRSVNGNEYWVVQVSAGQDMNNTILRLKDAGFESFPVN